jgi:hypothetical protein
MKLEAKNIVKKYRSRTVVNDVSFEVNQALMARVKQQVFILSLDLYGRLAVMYC